MEDPEKRIPGFKVSIFAMRVLFYSCFAGLGVRAVLPWLPAETAKYLQSLIATSGIKIEL